MNTRMVIRGGCHDSHKGMLLLQKKATLSKDKFLSQHLELRILHQNMRKHIQQPDRELSKRGGQTLDGVGLKSNLKKNGRKNKKTPPAEAQKLK